MRRSLNFALRRDVILASVMTLLVVILMTWGKPFMEIPGFMDGTAHINRSIDLELFNGFDHPTTWWAPWTNTLGNIAMFMPVGIAGFYLTRSRWQATLLALGLSVLIEAGQFIFAIGFSDIDDLLCNGIGAVLGATLVSVLNKKQQQKLMNLLIPVLGLALMVLFGALLLGLVVS